MEPFEIYVEGKERGRLVKRYRKVVAGLKDQDQGYFRLYAGGGAVTVVFGLDESHSTEGVEIVAKTLMGGEIVELGRYRVGVPPFRYSFRNVKEGVEVSVSLILHGKDGVTHQTASGIVLIPQYELIPLCQCKLPPVTPPLIKGGFILISCPEKSEPKIIAMTDERVTERFIPIPLNGFKAGYGSLPEIITSAPGVTRFDLTTMKVSNILVSLGLPVSGFSSSEEYIAWLEYDSLKLFERSRGVTYIFHGSPLPGSPPCIGKENLIYLEGDKGGSQLILIPLKLKHKIPLSTPLKGVSSFLLIEGGGNLRYDHACYRDGRELYIYNLASNSEMSIRIGSSLNPFLAGDGMRLFYETREGQEDKKGQIGIKSGRIGKDGISVDDARIQGILPAVWGENLAFFRKDGDIFKAFVRIPRTIVIDDASPFFSYPTNFCKQLSPFSKEVRERGYFYGEGVTSCPGYSEPSFLFKNLIEEAVFEVFFSGDGCRRFWVRSNDQILYNGEIGKVGVSPYWQRVGEFKLPRGEVRFYLAGSSTEKPLIYDGLMVKRNDVTSLR